MKAISVVGYHHTGKTTTVVALINALKQKGFSVSSIKDIHYENYRADKEDSNSDKHAKAGAEMVFARGMHDTALIFPRPLQFAEMASMVKTDYLIVEGLKNAPLPKIVCAENESQLDELIDDRTIAISGLIASRLKVYRDLPVFCLQENLESLVQTVISKSFQPLPDVDRDCCGECGKDCLGMAEDIVRGRAKRSDCVLDSDPGFQLFIEDQEVSLVPFVQRLMADNIRAFIKNLKDTKADGEIRITLK